MDARHGMRISMDLPFFMSATYRWQELMLRSQGAGIVVAARHEPLCQLVVSEELYVRPCSGGWRSLNALSDGWREEGLR